jgi:parvulin-like peptidyl-prolyl isomerase
MIARKWTVRGLAGAWALACVAGTAPAQAPGTAPAAVPPPAAAPPPAAQPPAAGPVTPVAATAAQGAAAKPLAVVNGEPISRAEVEALIGPDAPAPSAVSESVRKRQLMLALDQLIDMKLMSKFLAENAPPVTPAEVDQKIKELEEELRARGGKNVEEFLREVNRSGAPVRTMVAQMIQAHKYAASRVDEKAMQEYYTNYRELFDQVLVRASHVYLAVPADAPAPEVAAATAKLTQLREQIVAGKVDFAAAAKQHSQCGLSATQGGDIGAFPRRGVVDEAFAKAAFALKVGEVSGVVRTETGLHLIKCTDRKEGPKSEYAKVKEAVREACVQEMLQELRMKLHASAKVEVNLQ